MSERELRLAAAVNALVVLCDSYGVVCPSDEVILEECRRSPADPLETVREIRTRINERMRVDR